MKTTMVSRRSNELRSYTTRVRFFLRGLRDASRLAAGASVLFVGCGTCEELFSLHSISGTSYLVGLDVEGTKLAGPAATVDFGCADAQSIPIKDGCFDFCYCFHSLEHMTNPTTCVSEIARVLRDEGELFISTPNRRRLVGYVSSAQRETARAILLKNVREWVARCKGEFEPEKGYHCGFTLGELCKLLTSDFKEVRFVSEEYAIYMAGPKYHPLVRLMNIFKMLRAICTSHAVFCRHPRRMSLSRLGEGILVG